MTTYEFPSDDAAIEYLREFLQHESMNYSSATSGLFILKTIKATKSILNEGDATTCPICMGDFELDEKLLQLPCHHWFHRHCILPWLKEKSTCPMCRYELPKLRKIKSQKFVDGYIFTIHRSSGRIITTVTIRRQATMISVSVEDTVIDQINT